MTKRLVDNQLSVTRALPSSATDVTSTAIDLGNSTKGDFVAECELEIVAPALLTGELGDAATMTYDIIESANSDLSSPTTILPGILVQTGAGGAGAAAATKRIKLPDGVARYIGLKATNSAAGDASGKSATAALVF